MAARRRSGHRVYAVVGCSRHGDVCCCGMLPLWDVSAMGCSHCAMQPLCRVCCRGYLLKRVVERGGFVVNCESMEPKMMVCISILLSPCRPRCSHLFAGAGLRGVDSADRGKGAQTAK